MDSSKDKRLRAFIKDVGLPLNRAPEALGLSPLTFLDWWSGHRSRVIKKAQFVQLGQYLHINEDSILEGTYDKDFVRSILFSGDSVMPEKYTQNQFSYLRSSAHIFKFLTLKYGQHFSDMIMRKLNISPLIYSDLNNRISLNYFMDLLDILLEHGFKQEDLDQLACVMFLSLDQTPQMRADFSKARNYYECYEVVARTFKNLDNNFRLDLDLDRTRFNVTTFLDYDNHAHIDFSKRRIDKILRYRLILAGWFPYLSNLAPSMPEYEVSYTSDGIRCDYTFNFPEAEARQIHLVTKKEEPSL
ncbi:MAG: hypothetical protein JNM24_16950 [Bdellovibrionaceae bacterium]|nr:hypothetical protein [Pseudobdellovibrionaceae bacterium]